MLTKIYTPFTTFKSKNLHLLVMVKSVIKDMVRVTNPAYEETFYVIN